MKLKDYLIASETNDYQPWILRPTALAVFCLLLWTLRIMLPASFSFAAPGMDPADLMARINLERTNRFIPTLVTDSRLMVAATSKSADMIERGYFAHVDPDGKYVWPLIESAGYAPYVTLGENLAMDFTNPANVVDAWMNSPTHRANIINSRFQDQGLAAIYGQFQPGHYSILITSLFGTLLKSTPPPPQPSEPSAPTQGSSTTTQPASNPQISEPQESELFPAVGDTSEKEPPVDLVPAATSAPAFLPVSEEAAFIRVLKFIFALLAAFYVIFLVIDSIIIRRAKIKRANISSSPHSLLFLLIIITNLLAALNG